MSALAAIVDPRGCDHQLVDRWPRRSWDPGAEQMFGYTAEKQSDVIANYSYRNLDGEAGHIIRARQGW